MSTHCTTVRINAGASSSPKAICQPCSGYILSRSAAARSCRKSCRTNCGPSTTDHNATTPATVPSTCGHSMRPAPRPRPLPMATDQSNNARPTRTLKSCPARAGFSTRWPWRAGRWARGGRDRVDGVPDGCFANDPRAGRSFGPRGVSMLPDWLPRTPRPRAPPINNAIPTRAEPDPTPARIRRRCLIPGRDAPPNEKVRVKRRSGRTGQRVRRNPTMVPYREQVRRSSTGNSPRCPPCRCPDLP